MDQSKEMAKLAYAALSEKKGGDIKIIDIHEVSVMADYFIIADGSNLNQDVYKRQASGGAGRVV